MPWRHYYKEDILIFKGTFKDGIPLKKHYYFHGNGKIKLFGKYKKGLKHQEWREFDEKGVLLHSYYYERGKLISIDGDVNIRPEQR